MKEVELKNIIQAIAKELKRLFPKIKVYDEGIEQGYKEPCFFIDFQDEEIKKMIGKRYSNIPKFRVIYFQDFKEENAKYKVYQIRDNINKGFDYITYKDMHFTIKNKQIEVQDKDLIFSFDIQYFSREIIENNSMFESIEKISEKEK